MGDHKDAYRYKAFISYSWADAKWGNWLQHAIETYRTPRVLVGEDKGHGPVPARLHPLFKDREEEAAGSSIGAAVEAALADSEFLIVVCSPNSAKSQWVNRELAWFKTHRDPSKVLALIVGGEPGDPANECFPKALTHHVAADLTITDIPEDAPLAADARESGDGKRRAKLKLAAAMLGVGLDELVRRDDRRRALRTRLVVGASLTLAAVMSTLTWFAVEARKEAEFQRNQADGLVEFMLTDLRDKLEPVGRLDALDVVGQRALDYYAKQKLGDLDEDSLGRRARALLLVGEVSNIRGDSDDALRAFQQAAATTQEQLARDPDNQQRLFDHAQSVFWVGYIAYNRGDLKGAEAEYREYKRLADRLIALDPKNPKWQMEGSYAETNLGVMFSEQERYAEAEPAFARGLKRIEAVARAAPYDAGRQVEIGQFINWLALTKNALGKFDEALALSKDEVSLYRKVLQTDPANTLAKNRLSVALQFMGITLLNLGDIKGSEASYRASLALNEELQAVEPGNTEWQEIAVSTRLNLASLLLSTGKAVEGRAALDDARDQLDKMLAKDPANAFWAHFLKLRQLNSQSRSALMARDTALAAKISDRALGLLDELPDGEDHEMRASTRLLAGEVQMALGNSDRASALWRAALQELPERADTDDERFALLKRMGREAEAQKIAALLDRRGFRHPAYLKER